MSLLIFALILAGTAVGGSSRVPDLTAEFMTCPIAPKGSMGDSGRINCCGVTGYSSASVSELMSAFPGTWGGRPMTKIGLGVKPPGLAFRFSHPVRVILVWNGGGLCSFDPPLTGPEPIDSVLVSFPPLPPSEHFGSTFFESDGFHFEVIDTAQAVVTATVNLVATYADPGDTVIVWGTEIGMPDIELRDEGLASPTSVEPTTWGQVKRGAMGR